MIAASTRTLFEESDGSRVRRTVLPGGLRVVTEFVPGVRSAAFGIWVGVGSRDERGSHMGSAHFLEHLLFKGTKRRSAMEISAVVEAVGGDLNAFTTKEYTCYHARVLDQDLPLAIDVVSDVVLNALIRDHDVESERGVILEEIAMHDDDPSDIIHDEFATAMFGDSPLGRPILGTNETIQALSRESIRSFYKGKYRPERMVVAAAGNVDHGQVVRLVRKAFAHVLGGDAEPINVSRAAARRSVGAATRVVQRSTEQAHVVLGVPGYHRGDQRRYATAILSTALGGGMSSRLFQEIREERGLAYSVYSFTQGFADTGIFGVYAGCLPGKVDTVLDVTLSQLEQVARNGLGPDEFARAKGQVKGGIVLGQEDTGARMNRIGKTELVGEPILSMGEVLTNIEATEQAAVSEVAEELFTRAMTLAVIGPYDSTHTFNAVA